MFVLELLGTLSLRSDARPVPVAAQQKRQLGLLAVIALAGKHGISRDRIEAYLWPETIAASAHHSLDQTLYAIRHSLDSEILLSTARDLSLNPDLIQVDLWEFEKSIRDRQWEAAVTLYKGPLFNGFHFGPPDSGDLESWIDSERVRALGEYQTALEFLADCAAQAGDHSRSVAWWRKLATSDPTSAVAAKKLMLAFAAAGDRAGAVRHARLYQELVRQELDIEPDAEIESMAIAFSRPAPSKTVAPLDAQPDLATDSYATGNSHRVVTPAHEVQAGKPLPNTRRVERVALYALLPVAVLMTAAAILGWMRPEASKPVVRYALFVDSSEAIARGKVYAGRLALSPDGSQLAYIGGRGEQLLIRPSNQLHATAVPATDGALTPFFSSDGRKVGFLQENKVEIALVDGGAPVIVNDTLTGASGASWGPDNFIYVDGNGPFSLLRVEAKAGAIPRWFTTLDTAAGEVDHTWPDVLPNGKGVLFTVTFLAGNVVNGPMTYAIAVADIPSGKHRVIVQNAMFARYAASGHLLYVTTDRKLMIVPFDQDAMKVTGTPTAVTDSMRLGSFGSADLAVSRSGRLVYATGRAQPTYELVWVTRKGDAQLVDPEWQAAEFLGFPMISPDGKSLAVSRNPPGEKINIWIKQLDRGLSRKLTLEGDYNVGPTWSPDGKSVTYSSTVGGRFRVWTKRADGSAHAVLQAQEARELFDAHWSPDGKSLVFQSAPEEKGAGDILVMRPGIDAAPVPLLAEKYSEITPTLSPDGHWLAYTSNETGHYEIYVVAFPKVGPGKWQISSGGGTEPVWSRSGKELFYRDGDGNLVAVKVKSRPTFSADTSTILFSATGFFASPLAPQYAVGPDDQRFLMVRTVGGNKPDKLIVVENWFEELRGKEAKK
jgi:DNA-binding SARP family transcriptional activator/dipeptidyl aminopeptidase/acylaminoacyl peptidase